MKKVFKVGDKEYAVVEPSAVLRREAQTEHSKVFGRCLRDPDILTRSELEDKINRRELWSEVKATERKQVEKELNEKLDKLEAGGIRLEEGKQLAFDIMDLRDKITNINFEYNQYYDHTVEARADEAAKDYLVAHCLVDNETGERVYKTVEEYIEKKDIDEVASLGSLNMMNLEYGSIEDIYRKMPENAFLIEYGFMNNDLRFINKEGKFTDRKGRLVNEEGRYIDEQGNFVDVDGNLIAESTHKPFLDDEGNPIEKKAEEKPEEVAA